MECGGESSRRRFDSERVSTLYVSGSTLRSKAASRGLAAALHIVCAADSRPGSTKMATNNVYAKGIPSRAIDTAAKS